MNHANAKDEVVDLIRIASTDESKAVEFIESRRWASGAACPRCGETNVYMMCDASTGERNKDFRWRCRGCKKMFTVRTGTIFEETRLPLRVWLHCFWRACSSKKGVSALQIKRECNISYKSALFVMHRIRFAVGSLTGVEPKLSGTIEADETYCGGKPRNKGPHNKRGMGTKKTPVFGVVERGGDVRYRVMTNVTSKTVAAAIAEMADRSSMLMTDESSAYHEVGKVMEGGHESVCHSAKEYVRGIVHTNTIEGAFSLIKRGLYGTFHAVSKKHLQKYLNEFEFRYNSREEVDSDRVAMAIVKADGKRLTYAEHVEPTT